MAGRRRLHRPTDATGTSPAILQSAVNSHNGRMRWKAALGHMFVMCIAAILLESRRAQATCQEQVSQGTFDVACICLNGNCEYTLTADGDKPRCSCENGMDVPEKNLSDALEYMKSTGKALHSVHLSGRGLTSLEPFVGNLNEKFGGTFVLERTSVTSLQPLNALTDVYVLSIQRNHNLTEIANFGSLAQVGSLYIGANGGLTSITGFESLEKVKYGMLIWGNRNLARISGFVELAEVAGPMFIGLSPQLSSIPEFGNLLEVDMGIYIRSTGLKNISGFGRIHAVGLHLELMQNLALGNVSGFQSLKKVGGHFWVVGNPALTDISGFQGLSIVKGPVAIYGTGLPNVDGLRSLADIGSDLICGGNHALVNVDGFESLKMVGRDLTIMANKQLAAVNGLKNVNGVMGSISILSNNGLENIDGLGNISFVGGNFTIRGNVALEVLHGLNDLEIVAGDLRVERNGNLANFSGIQKLLEVGRDLVISDNLQDNSFTMSWQRDYTSTAEGRRPELDDTAFQTLSRVGRDLKISEMSFGKIGSSYMPRLRSIDGSLLMTRSSFNGEAKVMMDLGSVGGSLQFIQNEIGSGGMLTMFESLTTICANKSLTSGCGVDIRDNEGYKHANYFSNLSSLNGVLSIVNNAGLESVGNFPKLRSVSKGSQQKGVIGDLFGGLVITSNPHLTALDGFGALDTVIGDLIITSNPRLTTLDGFGALDRVIGDLVITSNPHLTTLDGFGALDRVNGDLVISNNEALNRINLGSLSNVANLTRITANGNLPNFVSEEPLPYKEAGCRKRINAVPHHQGKDGNMIFAAPLLRKDDCKVEIWIPTAVGFAIIGAMVIFSAILFQHAWHNFECPYLPRRPKSDLVAAFSARVLALADVLSDMGFAITAFILWEDKSEESIEGGEVKQDNHPGLLMVAALSTAIILGTQIFLVTAVLWVLKSKNVAREIKTVIEPTLYDHLLNQRAMRKIDWFLLFPGLLIFDAEVIKYLPWRPELTMKDDEKTVAEKGGFVHKYFARVAFLAGMFEDLPQIALQIAFVIIIEEDDGWAITGAMASLTLSVADAMVKFVFPAIITHMSSRHLTRERAFRSSEFELTTSVLDHEALVP